MAEHTRGPWRQGKVGDSIVCDTPADKDSRRENECREYYGGYLIAESVPLENRALIIAAPDLLVACEAARTAIDELLSPPVGRRTIDYSTINKACAALASAIAKARGQEPR